ncbi:tyrosine-type recombinase/integrase [Halostreptopolyspora alba]|uniref:Integrase n=1 Tax=Halostreptopolyspora alba TaxID=2487137 RepID=A0A3N0E6U7_9ACTN|nr:integrase [Nocardiopsaceae bacterium YIM 96095]
MDDATYDVRIWKKIEIYKGKRKTTHWVRWRVGESTFKEPHSTAALADSFRSELVAAANSGEKFSLITGRPVSWESRKKEETSWFAFVCEYMDEHWSNASASHRKDRAKYLANATMALLDESAPGRPEDANARGALRNWAFNTAHRGTDRTAEVDATLKWLEKHTLPVSAIADPVVARRVLTRITSKLPENGGGTLGAKAAVKAKRILSHCLDFAVERGHLPANPVSFQRNPTGAIKWKPPKVSNVVDRRAVPNPKQARGLLNAVDAQPRTGYLLMPFFAVMYFAALRPEEAANLTWANVSLPEFIWDNEAQTWSEPENSWGEITVGVVTPDVGRRWTDTGKQRDCRSPKGRAEGESRTVPCGPKLSRILWEHRHREVQGPHGLVFFGETGRQIATSTYSKVWKRARKDALTEEQFNSPLAKRPYDLRHACVSTWLNQGVNPAQIAEWAGHSLDVLLRIYARCLDGGEQEARRRAEDGFNDF